jgi:hypothetical protein
MAVAKQVARAGRKRLAERCGMSLIFEASLFRLVAKLQGDEQSLEGPQQTEANNKR